MEEKKILLSVKDLEVKFHVRSRILTAIRGISLDIYENESIAIVGESGSGKSVFTKTFAGMLDSNGFISKGDLILYDDEISDTKVKKIGAFRFLIHQIEKNIDRYTNLEFGAETYKKIIALKDSFQEKFFLPNEEWESYKKQLFDLNYAKTEEFNLRQTFDSKLEKDKIKESTEKIKKFEEQIKAVEKERDDKIKQNKINTLKDVEYMSNYKAELAKLKAQYKAEIAPHQLDKPTFKRNHRFAKEIYLSIGRYPLLKRIGMIIGYLKSFKKAMKFGVDLSDEENLNKVFDPVAFRVKYLDETEEYLHGTCTINLSKIRFSKDWQAIRGTRVATVFQDPMTSLNPILTIGQQISSVIMKHQHISEAEARVKAVELMGKVGIPNPETRYEDYPFQYSGGMRQRIVIAIALSCQPKILICDEPTTALDVTIQAQILKLIKELQKEFNFTIVFITHDLGVVANVADRVAVLYAGQIIELGTVEDVFYDPRHPYTWALLSSLPQLASKDGELYSIAGTPPSLYNKIIGDPFAPRNPYCLKIDTLKDSPMFKVSETHYAKTWLLDPRAPKVQRPKVIDSIHEKLKESFNIKGGAK